MLARIADNHHVYLEQLSNHEEKVIDDAFSVEVERSYYIDVSDGFFDGVIRKFNRKHQRLALPFISRLRRVCNLKGFPLQVIDDRPAPKYEAPDPSIVTPDLLPGITLEDYQMEAAIAAINNEVGLIQATTGAGKTEIMASITKIMNCPTVILCDMKTIVDQIKDRLILRDIAGGGTGIGWFYAGQRPSGQKVIIGSFQSLIAPAKPPAKTKKDTAESYARKISAFKTRRKNATQLREIVKRCDMLLVDECDTATSKQWRKLFKFWFKGRRKYGFSGTCFDDAKPVDNMSLEENLGSIICNISRKRVEKTGRIIPVKYSMLSFGDESRIKDKTMYDLAMKEQIIENEKFHKLVAGITANAIKNDPEHGVLILVESKPLGYTLEEMIPDSVFICGDTKMSARRQAVKDFESRKLKVLIGGKIAKRGLDLKGGCETLIIATGGKLGRDFNQKVGRAVRVNKRGWAQIYDFFFIGNHYLYEHSRRRLKELVKLEYPAKVVFEAAVIDAEKFIKSRFRRPRKKSD